LQIESRTEANTVIVTLSGEIDLDSSPEVRKIIIAHTKKKHPQIIIDLKNVTYMDSSGIATLVEGLQYSNQRNGKFAVANLGPGVREVFELSRLDKIFKIYEDVNQALEHIS
jgi:anti-sigma B factor antagonist